MKITKQELRKMINGIIKQGYEQGYDNNEKDTFQLQRDLIDGDIVPEVIRKCYTRFMEQCGDKLFSIFEQQLNKYLLEKYETSYQQLEQTQQSIKDNFEGTLYDMIQNRYLSRG